MLNRKDARNYAKVAKDFKTFLFVKFVVICLTAKAQGITQRFAKDFETFLFVKFVVICLTAKTQGITQRFAKDFETFILVKFVVCFITAKTQERHNMVLLLLKYLS